MLSRVWAHVRRRVLIRLPRIDLRRTNDLTGMVVHGLCPHAMHRKILSDVLVLFRNWSSIRLIREARDRPWRRRGTSMIPVVNLLVRRGRKAFTIGYEISLPGLERRRGRRSARFLDWTTLGRSGIARIGCWRCFSGSAGASPLSWRTQRIPPRMRAGVGGFRRR